MGKSRFCKKQMLNKFRVATGLQRLNWFHTPTLDNFVYTEKNSGQFYNSDDDALCSAPPAFARCKIRREHVTSLDRDLERFLDDLDCKRASTREKALLGLVQRFESNVLDKFVENKCITLLCQFIKSFEQGSITEACLASRAIGLLALTAGSGGCAHELMEETMLKLSPALHSKTDLGKISYLIKCLSVVTFVGADNLDEIEKSMKILWEVIHPKACTDAGSTKQSPPALAALAIVAWSFLLTAINDFRINPKNWQECLPFFSTLLQKDEHAIRMVSGVAIALIFEIGRLDKFSRDEGDISNLEDEGLKPRGFSYIESLKGKILNQVRELAMEAGGKGTTNEDLRDERNLFRIILEFLETGELPDISMKISNKWAILSVSTWSQYIKLNFLRQFLGEGFLKHMQDNELLHDVFDMAPVKKEKVSTEEKTKFASPSVYINKERTKFRNKQRSMAKARKEGHFAWSE